MATALHKKANKTDIVDSEVKILKMIKDIEENCKTYSKIQENFVKHQAEIQ